MQQELFIHGVGHFHPDSEIDNAFLESLGIGTSEQWVMERVGIRRRRTVLDLEYIRSTRNVDASKSAQASAFDNAQTGARAARMALERAGLTPADIGLVIAGGCSPQYLIPAEACRIAAELGITAPAFDINSACSSFAVQLHFLRSVGATAAPRFALVINAENSTRTVNYNDRSTAVLWGDATSAAVVSLTEPAPMRAVFSTVQSDPSGWDKVMIPPGGHFTQSGSAVQMFAIKKSLETLQSLREHATVGPERLYFIGHQANLRMLESVCARGEIPADRHLYNVDEFGNCGAAGAPSVLSQHWKRFGKGDEIALVVVGSGLTWGGLLLRVE